jgi:GNAT superfamily N-acetyltransferase
VTRERTVVVARRTEARDFPEIIQLCSATYRGSPPWNAAQLASHLRVFPEGQFVAVDSGSGRIVGMAASLVIHWDDYDFTSDWRDFTDGGMFTNHDPVHGRTLYGAEVMVSPDIQRAGVGSILYRARRDLVVSLGLRRIRAAARLRGYHRYAAQMSAEAYVMGVVRGEIGDPTLSFQIKHGFDVLGVVPRYLHSDPESLGFAAVIEWLNPNMAKPEDLALRDPRFKRPGTPGAS